MKKQTNKSKKSVSFAEPDIEPNSKNRISSFTFLYVISLSVLLFIGIVVLLVFIIHAFKLHSRSLWGFKSAISIKKIDTNNSTTINNETSNNVTNSTALN